MNVYEIQGSFGIENLKVAERPDPVAGPGQVVVKVKSAAINYRDLLMVKGQYNPKQPLPLIPFSDGAGEVVSVGDGATRVAVGDRVAGCFFQGWIGGKPTRQNTAGTSLGSPLDGMLAEYVALSEDGVVKVPGHLSDTEASTLPCAPLTAWSCMWRHGYVQPGDTVLALGTGGVSISTLQLAKIAGAKVIITSSSDEKLERAKSLGADHTINYKTIEKWSKEVRNITGGEGVDHIVEVGGVGTLDQSIRSVRVGGHISLVGILAGMQNKLNLTSVLMGDIRIQGVFVGPRDCFEDMNRAIEAHQMRPVVDKAFGWSEAQEALKHVESGSHFGKVCITVND
ncbi:MAG: NAD(P)-dependent alcohol dehydrogenase [Candidatus Hydrogenedentes bacterium]|jgi:NADPH:quinone reductase-like Zn-dependent oxidoreductase|nr:NAD(P)-dependent alcohol dehydrogenase [Candidatus Hydrogenedentota bacterium]